MDSRRVPHHLVSLLCLAVLPLIAAACVPLRPATPMADPGLVVTNARDAEVSALRLGDAVIVEVRSTTGIGDATIDLSASEEMREIILRLDLAGLENLTFTAPDGHVVTVAVSSSDTIVRQTLRSPGSADEEEIRSGHAWWMDTGIISNVAAVDPSIPLENGHFDVAVPRAFLRDGGRTFDLSWIDFYR